LVHPYVELLKKAFAPKCEKGESYDTYLNLIYGQQCKDGDEEEFDSLVSDNDEIPSGGSRRHWQYTHCQFWKRILITKGRGRGKGRKRTISQRKDAKNETNVDEFNQIESLPAANTVGLQKVRAAIFLSLDELYSNRNNIGPQFKDFKWDDIFEEKEKSLELLQNLYDSMKEDSQPRDMSMQQQMTFYDYSDDDDFFKALENKVGGSASVAAEDEVLRYIGIRQINIDQDPLKWWDMNKSEFPVLSHLAQKYLSIPATSVPSKRSFSTACNYISAKRTQLSPDLVNQ
ncbi:6768_t:CDS:2, partial [Racocetra persica]